MNYYRILFEEELWEMRYLFEYSLETESFLRPLARRADNTFRPLAVDILSRKPCLFFLFLFDGWNVLFIFRNILYW